MNYYNYYQTTTTVVAVVGTKLLQLLHTPLGGVVVVVVPVPVGSRGE